MPPFMDAKGKLAKAFIFAAEAETEAAKEEERWWVEAYERVGAVP